MEKIPFARPYLPPLAKAEAVAEYMRMLDYVSEGSARISNGEHVEKLEEVVTKMSGADYAVACSSCTQATILGLGSCGVRAGEGHTASFTWDSTAIAMTMQGSHVTMHDIDLERWCVPAYEVGSDPKTGGYVVAVDTFGLQYNPVSYVPLFYDRAHSIGQRFRQIGLASFLSFSPSKLVTAGEGGMILCNKEPFVKAMRAGRDITCRMPEANALLALEGLKHIDELLEWKRDTYNFYKQRLPFIFQDCTGGSNHQVIGMLLDSHEQQEKLMGIQDIELKFYYKPLHKRSSVFAAGQLPNTMSVFERIVCLPSWMGVDRQYIVDRIKEQLEL